MDQEGKVGDCAMLQRGPGTSVSAESVSTRKAGGRRTDDRDKTQIVSELGGFWQDVFFFFNEACTD